MSHQFSPSLSVSEEFDEMMDARRPMSVSVLIPLWLKFCWSSGDRADWWSSSDLVLSWTGLLFMTAIWEFCFPLSNRFEMSKRFPSDIISSADKPSIRDEEWRLSTSAHPMASAFSINSGGKRGGRNVLFLLGEGEPFLVDPKMGALGRW